MVYLLKLCCPNKERWVTRYQRVGDMPHCHGEIMRPSCKYVPNLLSNALHFIIRSFMMMSSSSQVIIRVFYFQIPQVHSLATISALISIQWRLSQVRRSISPKCCYKWRPKNCLCLNFSSMCCYKWRPKNCLCLNFTSMLLRTTSDDQLFLFFLMFSYIYVNVKFNLN